MSVVPLMAKLRALRVEIRLDGDKLRLRAPEGALGPRLKEELAARKPELIAFLRQAEEQRRTVTAMIAPAPRQGPIPVSFAQQRLWFLEQLEPGSATYNIPTALALRGSLEVSTLAAAASEIGRRHESLRTTFAEVDDQPVQIIHPSRPLPLPVIDLSGLPTGHATARSVTLLSREASNPFDLQRGPVCRLLLLRRASGEHLLGVNLHHIVADGWSVGVLIRELTALYSAYLAGAPSPLPELPIQYVDFSIWQRSWLTGEVLQRQLDYWQGQLTGAPGVLELPTDRPRPPQQSFAGAKQLWQAPAALLAKLHALANQQEASLFMVLLAAFRLLVTRLSNQADTVVGTPIANRNRSEIEPLIGFFVNTLALRGRIAPGMSFRQLLDHTRDITLEAYAHQDLPFERLVEVVDPERDLSRHPIFQVMFALQNAPQGTLTLPGLELGPAPGGKPTSKFDWTLSLWEAEGHFGGWLEYATDLYDATTVRRVLATFRQLLEAVVARPDGEALALELLSQRDRQQLLFEWNPRLEASAGEELLHRRFVRQALATPEAKAVTHQGRSLSYRQLEAHSRLLAAHLRRLGIGPDVAVGLSISRSLPMPVAVLAILRAGGVCVPLDPAYPADRLEFMVADCGAPVVLTDRATERVLGPLLGDKLPDLTAAVSVVEDVLAEAREGGSTGDDLCPELSPENLFYVIYTSGSTGRPKGVSLAHRALANLIDWHLRENARGVRSLQFASQSFDACYMETFRALCSGGTLVLIDEEERRDLAALARVLVAERVEQAVFPVVLLQQLAEEYGPGGDAAPAGGFALTEVSSTGEQAHLTPAVKRFLAALGAGRAGEGRYLNEYGPSETHVVTCWRGEGEPADWPSHPPIGRPIANALCFIFDRWGRLASPAAPGELYLGGVALARGYLGRPALTAERFVPHPEAGAAGTPGARLYRSGDLARLRPDGQLEYLGRIDHQIKVRGFRVEMGEVESALSEHPAVGHCTVISDTDGAGARRLLAYVVAAEGRSLPPVAELREHLAARLPDYMVPAWILPLPELPMNPNRKVDRQALPTPESVGLTGGEEYTAPRTLVEEMLAEIWSEVLGRPRIGVHDDFFALGGHSLLATQVVSRLRRALAVELPVRSLFLKPTIARLAPEVERVRRVAEAGDGGSEIPELALRPYPERPAPLSFAQERLWFVCRLVPDSPLYNLPSLLRLRGVLDAPALSAAVVEIVRRHEVLRAAIEVIDGVPRQRTLPLASSLPAIDLSALPEALRAASWQRLTARISAYRFDLRRGPLYRAALVRLAPEDHLALFVLHHLASDGWSQAILTRELTVLYEAFAAGRRSPLAPPPVQYADFAQWQRGWLAGELLEREVEHWRARLAGAPPLTELPLDRPRPPVAGWHGAFELVALPPALVERLRAFGRQRGLTLYMTLLAGFQALLYRYGAQRDLCLGSPIAGRNRAEIEGLIGFFVNTLVVRARIDPQQGFAALAAAAREEALAGHAHQDLPFETLVQRLAVERSLSHSPIFQAVFGLQNAPAGSLELPGLALSRVGSGIETARFDLAMTLFENAAGVSGQIGYKSDLFDRATVRRLAAHFRTLLAAAMAEPERPLPELAMLRSGELHQLLVEHNRPRPDYRVGQPVHERFAAFAAEQPEAIALIEESPDGLPRRVTYGTLARRSALLAQHLQRLGVGPENVVGVAIPRSVAMVEALLGVLGSGAAYLPLDPDYPQERLRFMLEDAQGDGRRGPRVVLAAPEARERLPVTGATILTVRQALVAEAGEPTAPPAVRSVNLDCAAYVIYTSGSTGRPKGVVISHRALANRLQYTRAADVDGAYRYLHKTTIGFDVSLVELFQPLAAAGGQVVMAAAGGQLDLPYLLGLMARQRVTHAAFPPSVLTLLIDRPELAAMPAFKVLYAVAEAFSPELARRCVARFAALGIVVENRYGPTEATIGALAWRVEAGRARMHPLQPVPVGLPIARARVHVVDAALRPLPAGAAGELVIAGDGLARGYLGRPARTAGGFVPDPFAPTPGGRLYRTGDRGRRRGDGAIEFLGRVDHQVKVRGFRVELGEVETALAAHPALAEVAVVDLLGPDGTVRLAAYAAPLADTPKPTVAELKGFLAESLPDHMVPTSIDLLPALPRLPNGKLDRRALPAPAPVGGATGAERGANARRLPRDEAERTIAALWRELLEVDEIGADDNFFDLGGHSLLLVRLQSRLGEELGEEPSMVDLFRLPTVAAQAELLRGRLPERRPATTSARRHRATDTDGALGHEVAIVGMACRYPGARDLEEFWCNLRDGVESIRFYSPEELREAGVPEALSADPRYVPAQAYLEDVDRFDAALFGLTPREAQLLDPQQRVFLECAWTALEHAGYDPSSFDGEIGVYAGVGLSRYWMNLFGNPELVASVGELPILLANDKDFLPTRVSYLLDLKGPSMNVNTACSTSLVAAHLACRNLMHGECDMALAGGVSIAGRDRHGYSYQEGSVLSDDGHNRSYDAAAKGTIASAGAGVVVLKRLADALADGDTVWAVIRGSAVNNDGADKIGFTAPSVDGQARVIAEAQADAGVEPSSIGMIEGHGSATALGDPIEVAALTQVFAAGSDGGRLPAESVALGSVKSNIGHAGSAAGAAGLIKAALALAHRRIPPSLSFERPNPQIDFAAGPFFVNRELRDWRRPDGVGTSRRAGVSAFGLGGTNVHMVLEEAPPSTARERSETAPAPESWQLLPLSAATEPALEAATDALGKFLLAPDGQPPLADVAFTLQVGRRRLRHRRFVVCRQPQEAGRILVERDGRRLLGGSVGAGSGIQEGGIKGGGVKSVAFLLPGLGEHYPEMARGLYDSEPVFRAALDRYAELLAPRLEADLREVLFARRGEGSAEAPRAEPGAGPDLRAMLGRGGPSAGDGSADGSGSGRATGAAAQRLHRTRFAQPAVFAVEVALAALWREWGIEPEALLGYSLGEYTAAHLAGVLSLPDALTVVAERARWIDELPAGVMLAVPLPEAELLPLLAAAGGDLAVAAVQAPAVTVAAGPEAAVAALEAVLTGRDLVSRRLPSTHAFHSPMMAPVAERLAELMASVELRAPRVPYVSNVTGRWIEDSEATDPRYWARHLCQTVRFSDGLATLLGGERVLLEIGPGQGLGTAARQHPERDERRHPVIAALRDERERSDDVAFALDALGRAWLAGATVDWQRFGRHQARRRVPLPTYRFDRQQFWVEATGLALAAGSGSPLPAGAAGRRGGGKQPRIDDWFYLPRWQRAVLGDPEAGADGSEPEPDLNHDHGAPSWLLLCGRTQGQPAVGEALFERLAAAGQAVTVVYPGTALREIEADRWELDPTRAEDYAGLLSQLRQAGCPPNAIVHLWSAEAADPAAGGRALDDRDGFDAAQRYGLHSLLALISGMAASGTVEPIALTVVTRGARRVEEGDVVRPEQEPMLGALRVIPQEYRNLRCRVVDLPAVPPPAASRAAAHLLDRLYRELRATVAQESASSGLTVALRTGGRWRQSYEPVAIPAALCAPSLPKAGGVYLLTGGLGRIGLTLASMLAERYRARLVLTARTPLPPRAEWDAWLAEHPAGDLTCSRIRRIRAMEEAGAEVLALAADVGDPVSMRQVLAAAEQRFGAIDGVVHLAGNLRGGVSVPADATGVEVCARQMAPKVAGLWVLEELLAGRELDFCLLFSSLSTVLGGLGFAAYAAANAYMDAFVHRHNTEHPQQPWVSVDWDGWQVHDPTLPPSEQPAVAAASQRASQLMTPQESVEAFRRVLALAAAPQVVVSTGDLQVRLDTWYPAMTLSADEQPAAQAAGGRPELATPYVAPSDEIEVQVAQVWEGLLGLAPVGIYDHYFELGGDSLLATQMISRLRGLFKVQLGLADLFAQPTVAGVAERLRAKTGAEGGAPLDELEALLGEIEGLDDDEARARLDAPPAGGPDPQPGQGESEDDGALPAAAGALAGEAEER